MKDKKGFTLIELLVVVLIIGILATIALPQYRLAVTKTKIASMFPLMRAWKDAVDIYYTEHGVFPADTELDVSWPSDWVYSDTDEPCENRYNCQNEEFQCWSNDGYVACEHLATHAAIFMFSSYDEEDPDAFFCHSGKGGETAEKVCKALGGMDIGDGNFSLN